MLRESITCNLWILPPSLSLGSIRSWLQSLNPRPWMDVMFSVCKSTTAIALFSYARKTQSLAQYIQKFKIVFYSLLVVFMIIHFLYLKTNICFSFICTIRYIFGFYILRKCIAVALIDKANPRFRKFVPPTIIKL